FSKPMWPDEVHTPHPRSHRSPNYNRCNNRPECNTAMRTIWQALIWKEWHEHKWKFVSIVAILWCTAIISLTQREPDAFGLSVAILAFCLIPLSIFVGLGAAANERSRGTFAFTQALPAPIWRIAFTKLISGLLVLIGSVVLTLPVYYAWAHGHGADPAL